MNLMRKITIGFLLIHFGYSAFTQDCKGVLKEHFDKMASINNPQSNSVYFMSLRLSYRFWDPKVKMIDLDAKIYISSKSFAFESSYYSIYSDPTDFFYIDNSQLKIFWKRGNAKFNYGENIRELMLGYQKELLDFSTVGKCIDSTINKLEYRYLRLDPNLDLFNKYYITSVEYLFKVKSRTLERVELFYAKGQKFKQQSLLYKDLNLDFKGRKLLKPYDVIFESNGKLREEYKNFTIVDDDNE